MPQAKKLIEVAMPVKEVSAESVRDKSIRHGHISTLHLWWARRPLPVCRAVVFASLVPDPLDEHCPQAFRDAVELLLGREHNPGDPYKPYEDIPYTSAIDRMEDNLRNRLLMFIGKFSEEFIRNTKGGKATASNKQISDASLIKWESKNNIAIIGKARKLIWTAYNSVKSEERGAEALLADFDKHYKAIREAEEKLYSTADRHIDSDAVHTKEEKLRQAIDAFLDKMPKVFDPFAGGGAIPLEATRLGCRSYGNDINPVAHIIQKGSLEFPQKYGKPISYSKEEFIKLYGEGEYERQSDGNTLSFSNSKDQVIVHNRLAFDVEFYSRKLLTLTEKEIGHLYPKDEKGRKPLVYFWARVGNCNNPTCRAEVPLLKKFYVSQRRNTSETEWVYLKPIIDGNSVAFEICKGKFQAEGWIVRGNMKCPCCGNTTSNAELKKQFVNKEVSNKLIAVLTEDKKYRLANANDEKFLEDIDDELFRPNEGLPVTYTKAMAICLWGFTKWGDIFSARQLRLLNTLTNKLADISLEVKSNSEYSKAIITYLQFFIDRIAMRNTTFNAWHIQQDTVEKILGKYDIPMVFEYPEANPFSGHTSSAAKQIQQIKDYIESEGVNSFSTICNNAASGDKEQFPSKYLNSVITDPPYYDVVAYADLSDFFYVWMKRTLKDVYPLSFSTPQTPKSDECTALKHHHGESSDKAKEHFETKLLQILDAIEHQTEEVVSIMYAHQSTEAWTTLCNSILGARLNITGSWAVDSEVTGGFKDGKAFLASSVTVSCRPAKREGTGEFKDVKKAIERTVAKEVDILYRLGFRGADLLTACFGQAVSEFGKYEKVEKADGSDVTVAELLELAKESAFNALLKGFAGDDPTKFYIGWLQLYGFNETEFDDAAKLSRVGLSIDVQELFHRHIFIKKGNKQTLAGYKLRWEETKSKLGIGDNSLLIDKVHRVMYLFDNPNRGRLLEYINKVGAEPESALWRVLTSIAELTKGSEDGRVAEELLTNKDNLLRESMQVEKDITTQTQLEL